MFDKKHNQSNQFYILISDNGSDMTIYTEITVTVCAYVITIWCFLGADNKKLLCQPFSNYPSVTVVGFVDGEWDDLRSSHLFLKDEHFQ